MDKIIFVLLSILLVFAALKMVFVFFTILSSFKTGGAVFTTTHHLKIEKILETVTMESGQVVYDLGCGDGRFLTAAAKRYNVNGIGFEINPWAYLLSKLRIGLSHPNISIHFQDFWKANLNDADIIFCYLFPDVMERLRDKLSQELRFGTKVISCNFEIPGWTPEKVITASNSIHNEPIFIYFFQQPQSHLYIPHLSFQNLEYKKPCVYRR